MLIEYKAIREVLEQFAETSEDERENLLSKAKVNSELQDVDAVIAVFTKSLEKVDKTVDQLAKMKVIYMSINKR